MALVHVFGIRDNTLFHSNIHDCVYVPYIVGNFGVPFGGIKFS